MTDIEGASSPEPPSAEFYLSHVAELRDSYVNSTLSQRYGVALQRLDPAALPNQVVNEVLVLEAIARSVALEAYTLAGDSRSQAYAKVKKKSLVDLLEIACEHAGVQPSWFNGQDWERLPCAVAYRNLLVHEATFLDGGICREMIAVSRRTLDRLWLLAQSRLPLKR